MHPALLGLWHGACTTSGADSAAAAAGTQAAQHESLDPTKPSCMQAALEVLNDDTTKADVRNAMAHAEAWTGSSPGAGLSREAFTHLVQELYE